MTTVDEVLDINSGPPPTLKQDETETHGTPEVQALSFLLQFLYPPDKTEDKEDWFERAKRFLKKDHDGWPLMLVNFYNTRPTCGVVHITKALKACAEADKKKREFMCVQMTQGLKMTAPSQLVVKAIREATDKDTIPCVTRFQDGDFIISHLQNKIQDNVTILEPHQTIGFT
jgi:hypothetical protein